MDDGWDWAVGRNEQGLDCFVGRAHAIRPATLLSNNQAAAGRGSEVLHEAYGGANASAHFGYRGLPKLCSVAVTGMSILDQDSVNYACILIRMRASLLKVLGELL